jgi:hypothetical protein
MLFKEAGEALSKVGTYLQGSFSYKEKLNRHRRILNFGKFKPELNDVCFIAPSACVIGNVKIGLKSSVWYNAIIRGNLYLKQFLR